MNQKANLSMEKIIRWTLIIISFILITGFIGTFFSKLNDLSDEEACRASVIMRSKASIDLKIHKFTNLFPLTCKTKDYVLPTKNNYKNSAEKEEEIEDEIADLMAKCWWQFGNGNLNDILDEDVWGKRKCHVCYTFKIEKEENSQPISIDKFIDFLSTRPYHPGLLMSGGAVQGSRGVLTFHPQKTLDRQRNKEKMTVQRLLSAESRLTTYVADFTGVMSDEDLAELRNSLFDISAGQAIEPALIIVQSLPENVYSEENPSLPTKIMNEWGVGSEEELNGIVFIFDLSRGKLLFATQLGADAVLPKQLIEQLFSKDFKPLAEQNKINEALKLFVKDLGEAVKNKGTYDEIRRIVNFQRSYMAYLTGGSYGPRVDPSSTNKLKTQGAIFFQKTDDYELKKFIPGETYAIIYLSAMWEGCRSFFMNFCGNKNLPNLIGVVDAKELLSGKSGVMCHVTHT